MSWQDEINAKLDKHRQAYKKSGLTDTKISRSAAVTANNKRTWADPNVAKKRAEGIRKTKLENGAAPKELLHEIYNDSWGPDRRDGYIIKARKKLKEQGYNFHKDRIYHIVLNSEMTVSAEEHNENMAKWEKKYGFGTWEIHSPGIELLPIYDKYGMTVRQYIPPSIVWKIRFEMTNDEIRNIRDFLLPYTGNDYLKSPTTGRIENGRYINIRKKLYPYLNDKPSEITIIDNAQDMVKWLSKMMGRDIKQGYMHQIINKNNGLKETGPLAGYYFKRKTFE